MRENREVGKVCNVEEEEERRRAEAGRVRSDSEGKQG